MTEQSKRIVNGVYDAIIAGEAEQVFAALHPDFCAEIPPVVPWGGRHEGADAFGRDVLPGVLGVVDMSTLQVRSLFGEGEKVFATATLKTKEHQNEILIGEEWTVSDGKIANLRVFYFDPRPLLKAAGIS